MKTTLPLLSILFLATACADTVKTRELDRTDASSNAVVGEKGEKGDKGDKGEAGELGIVGASGVMGLPGVQGLQGLTGLKGDKGDKGEKGDRGLIGPKGDSGAAGSISKIQYGKLVDITNELSESAKIEVDLVDANLAQISLSFMLLRDVENAGASVLIYVIDGMGEKLLIRNIDVHSENNVRYVEYSHSFFIAKGSYFQVVIKRSNGVYVKYAQYSATFFK